MGAGLGPEQGPTVGREQEPPKPHLDGSGLLPGRGACLCLSVCPTPPSPPLPLVSFCHTHT